MLINCLKTVFFFIALQTFFWLKKSLRCYEIEKRYNFAKKTDKKTHNMGRKKLVSKNKESLFTTISKMLVPSHILENFDIWDAKEQSNRWVIEMREKTCRIPTELQEYEDVVHDGYCNPIETISHSFVCKPVYLRLFRRRYKRSNTDIHYSNSYDLTLKGVRIVPELGIFLKESD